MTLSEASKTTAGSGGTCSQRERGSVPRSKPAKHVQSNSLITLMAGLSIARQGVIEKHAKRALSSSSHRLHGRSIAPRYASRKPLCARNALKASLLAKGRMACFAQMPATTTTSAQSARCETEGMVTLSSKFYRVLLASNWLVEADHTGCGNTAMSCSKPLVGHLAPRKTCITSTGSATTTALKTLSFGRSLNRAESGRLITIVLDASASSSRGSGNEHPASSRCKDRP